MAATPPYLKMFPIGELYHHTKFHAFNTKCTIWPRNVINLLNYLNCLLCIDGFYLYHFQKQEIAAKLEEELRRHEEQSIQDKKCEEEREKIMADQPDNTGNKVFQCLYLL